MPDEVITFLAVRSGGDARTALNALELAIATAQRAQEPRVTLGDAEDSLQRKAVLYDKAGDQHYDYISAWIKSTRGSDPDASLYYLAAMIEGGEDPRFIARRMIVLASEDIGNADPQALVIAVAAGHAVEHVGLPRGGVRAHPGGDLPLAGAEVRRRQARDRRGPRPHPRARRQAAAGARCARPPTRRRASSGAARATTTRTTTRATSTTRSTCPRGSRACASTSPTRASRRRKARLEAIRKARGARGIAQEGRPVSGRACAHCCSPCSPRCCSPLPPRPPASSTTAPTSTSRSRRPTTSSVTVDRPQARRPEAADLHARHGRDGVHDRRRLLVFVSTGIVTCGVSDDTRLRLTTNERGRRDRRLGDRRRRSTPACREMLRHQGRRRRRDRGPAGGHRQRGRRRRRDHRRCRVADQLRGDARRRPASPG